MKLLPEVEDNFRTEPWEGVPGASIVRRDFVPPIPVGSFIAYVFQVTGYDQDCDGSAMARVEQVDKEGEPTGWTQDCLGLYAHSSVILSGPDELHSLAEATP